MSALPPVSLNENHPAPRVERSSREIKLIALVALTIIVAAAIICALTLSLSNGESSSPRRNITGTILK